MTPNQIIQQARAQFGESIALTVTAETFEQWVNASLKELYNDLPPSELRQLITEDPLALAGGAGTLPDAWDRVLEVKEGSVPLQPQPVNRIRAIDSNQFFPPIIPVWALSDKTLLVRPDTLLTVNVSHQDPPAVLAFPADGDTEITSVNSRWHIALVHLITSYAYQQEEDHSSATTWRNRYNQLVGQAQPAPADGEQG